MSTLSIYGNVLKKLVQEPEKRHQINLRDALLDECIDKYLIYQRKKNSKYSPGVFEKFKKMEQVIGEYLEPSQITDDFWVAFINWLQVDEGLRPNTVKVYCMTLRHCLSWSAKHGAIVDTDYENFEVDKFRPTKVALTVHQIHTIYDFKFENLTKTIKCIEKTPVEVPKKVKYHKRYGSKKPYLRFKRVYHEDGTFERIAIESRADWFKTKVSTVTTTTRERRPIEVEKSVPLLNKKELRTMDRVRDMLVLGCNLFQRHSDMIRINPSCFNADKTVFTMVQQKTGNTAVVDMKKYCIDYKITKAILEKYNYTAPYITTTSVFDMHIHKMLKLIGGEFNQSIKEEYKRLGHIITKERKLYEMVSSHTGRRTAVTYNALIKKVPHLDVMRCSGHADFRSFSLYLVDQVD